MSYVIYNDDCLQKLKTFEDATIDSIVTDPPYEIGFMGRSWDSTGIAYNIELWRECLRVLKPGGHLLAFGATRSYHRMAVAIEDAGFEIRDSIHWTYGSGFPKSLNVAKAIEKYTPAGDGALLPDEARFCEWMREHSGLTETDVKRLLGSPRFITGEVEIVNTATTENPRMGRRAMVPTAAAWERLQPYLATVPPEWVNDLVKNPPAPAITHPGEWKAGKGQGTDGSGEWAGWGTALKPSHEPIVVARKPVVGTVARNVLEYGTGGLNIDGTRVGFTDAVDLSAQQVTSARSEDGIQFGGIGANGTNVPMYKPSGRWPANTVLTHAAGCRLTGETTEHMPECITGTASDKIQQKKPGMVTPAKDVANPVYQCVPGCPIPLLDQQSGTNNNGGAAHVGRWPANTVLTHSAGCVSTGETRTDDITLNGEGNDNLFHGKFNGGHDQSPKAATTPVFRCVPGCPIPLLDQQSGERPGGNYPAERGKSINTKFASGKQPGDQVPHKMGDKGGASRFFTQTVWDAEWDVFHYCPKPSKRERNAGLDGLPEQPIVTYQTGNGASGNPSSLSEGRNTAYRNTHPTVKPVALIRHLTRLVTPPGGTVLDPFTGSGTTGVAAILEGFQFIGIELMEEYLPIIEGRLQHAQQQQENDINLFNN